jgi:hypothetical protein
MSDPFAYSLEDAFHGPLGEYARRNQVRVEIDSLSLLLQLLAVTSVADGRRAYAYGGPDRHYPNLYVLIVGTTGVGKGGSGTVANELGEAIDPGFSQRTAYNVASAPALVQLVSDGVTATERKKAKNGEYKEIQHVKREPVTDKRLLLFLPEFGSTLVAQKRDGSTLRDELKNAWDGRTIENNKHNCRERATAPHIGMIGHITPVDLQTGSTRADVGNGYLNRFLITEARSAQTLPFHVPEPDCSDLLDHLRGVLERLGPVNQGARCLDWAEDARDEWAAFYTAIKNRRHPFIADVPELAGRLYAQVMRVALNYALLDEAPAIHLQHLRAGKAVCLEALDRIRHLFTGKATGNSDSDLVQKLRTVFAGRKDSWKSTDLHKETGSRLSAKSLAQAAAHLVATEEWCVTEGKAGNGHAAQFWSWARKNEDKPRDVPHLAFEEEDIAEPALAHTVTVEGIPLLLGMPFEIRYNATALDFSGRPIEVRQGDRGHIASPARSSNAEDRNGVFDRIDKHPNHICVVIDDSVVFVPPKAIEDTSALEALPA